MFNVEDDHKGRSIWFWRYFDSPFVQERFTFGCFMATSPAGITGIEASNNLADIDRKLLLFYLDELVKSQESSGFVIPADEEIQ